MISGNKVYVNKTLTLDKENTKYLKYLYKIKDETFDLNYDVSLKRNVDMKINMKLLKQQVILVLTVI